MQDSVCTHLPSLRIHKSCGNDVSTLWRRAYFILHGTELTVKRNHRPKPPSRAATRTPATCRLPYKLRPLICRRAPGLTSPIGSDLGVRWSRPLPPALLLSLPREVGREADGAVGVAVSSPLESPSSVCVSLLGVGTLRSAPRGS